MSSTLVSVLVLAGTLAASGLLYWLLFNNKNGERYLKQDAQGPFANAQRSGGTDPE